MGRPLRLAEIQLREKLEKEGWTVVHKGWPDFVCIRGRDMMFVEVKGYRGEMLRREQHYILTNLAKQGAECYKWTPDGEFERIMPSTPIIIDKPNKRKVNWKPRNRLTLEEKVARLSPEAKIQYEKDLGTDREWYL